MGHYLIDSNILIYFLDGNERVAKFFADNKKLHFSISIVSRLEVMVGSSKHGLSLLESEKYLDLFENINLDKKIVGRAVEFSLLNKKKLQFKDLIIAATASLNGSTLVTSDRDFQNLSGVKVQFIKI